MENGEAMKKDTLATQWLSYHALFSEELIFKSDLKGEALYHSIRERIKDKQSDGNRQEYFIDNIISLD
jgi:hypothetical protein